MLLSDPAVKELLTDDLVPSWESVHETAKLTIDFANGKSLKRTIGGNTVIYICRKDGAVLDAFPGVWTPEDFLAEAATAIEVTQASLAMQTDARIKGLHKDVLAWFRPQAGHAISKAAIENPPILRGNFRGDDAPLVDLSKLPNRVGASGYIDRPKVNKSEKLPPSEFGKVLVQSDSRNNRYVVRPLVRLWLAERATIPQPSDCTEAIYTNILGTDLGDPYMGLLEAQIPGTSGLVTR